MTAKLKLKCLATDLPTPSDTTLLTFLKLKNTDLLECQGGVKANGLWAQMPAAHDVTRFYLDVYTVSAFLCENDLVELPDEKPNYEYEAYQKAYATWCSSSLRDIAAGRPYNDTRKLFISHELLKACYTISNELYNKYC